MKFQFFGSKSSIDYDIMVFVDELGSIEQNHCKIKELNLQFIDIISSMGLPQKKINCNLGVIKNDRVIKVFKGTYDECNNSLLITYDNHLQAFKNQILWKYDRIGGDNFYAQLKLKRCFRFILSFYSRIPERRAEIKLALKGSFDLRLKAISSINFNVDKHFPGKNELTSDIYKVIAFQLAQTLLLFRYVEIYTKEEVLEYFPQLKNPILRQEITEENLSEMTKMLRNLVFIGHDTMPNMSSLNEEVI